MAELIAWLTGAGAGALEDNVLLRSGLAAITAFAVTALVARWLLVRFSKMGIGEKTEKTDSDKIAQLHKSKKDTPTMGGVAMVAGMIASVLAWAGLSNPYVVSGMLVTLAFAAVGFLDDWIKLRAVKRHGLTIREKLALQAIVAAAASLLLLVFGAEADWSVGVFVPLTGESAAALPAVVFLGLSVIVLVSTVNAVNFTDGLDGLASGCVVITGIPVAAIAYLAGNRALSSSVGIPFVEGGAEMAVFTAAMTGSGLGFLWHNCFPARMFMGDTGSLALGGAIGFTMLSLKQELMLPLIGAVFVAEGMSVVLQVASFKLTGRRLFLIAPLHHRYQLLGLPETIITVRFWIAAAVSALVGAAFLKI